MCLFKKSRIPKIAIKDIVVYKVLNVYKHDGKKYYETYVRDFPVNLNETVKGVFRIDSFLISLFSDIIEDGYIHSYTNLKRAKSECIIKNRCVVKCIIPKGTLYWEGYEDELASRKLKYNKIIVPERGLYS